ncbi:hypothetical protein F4553_001268 [Allocatelliglobosispora scoriae]|uniref:Uncharacterized protein n=1 Tax=Allocatelliglobosispora scoriae TaxID=643052 RepID=A0A841BL16_9ACTN|nr:hypothetical protein [Allocatelliglobosispora scoriae]MBB5867889.1 hypothetical protein [Allocatelliglobosispora scoriae]
MRFVKAAVLGLLGLAILGATVVLTVKGTQSPSAGMTIAIALMGAIGVPIGFGALNLARQATQRPDAALLKHEAEAKRRTAAALEDAETAERLKAELDAFVALRARRLEIERRRQELKASAAALVDMHRELGTAEKQLGVAESAFDPQVAQILDEVMGLRLTTEYRAVKFYLGTMDRMLSIFLPIPAGGSLVESSERLMTVLDRRRMRRLAKLAPEALSQPGTSAPTPPTAPNGSSAQ